MLVRLKINPKTALRFWFLPAAGEGCSSDTLKPVWAGWVWPEPGNWILLCRCCWSVVEDPFHLRTIPRVCLQLECTCLTENVTSPPPSLPHHTYPQHCFSAVTVPFVCIFIFRSLISLYVPLSSDISSIYHFLEAGAHSMPESSTLVCTMILNAIWDMNVNITRW